MIGIEKRTHPVTGLRVIEINTANVGAILIADRDKATLPVEQRGLCPFQHSQCTTDVFVTCAICSDPRWRPVRMLP
jgi:hypothetical protein